jgi:hypothetical protein
MLTVILHSVGLASTTQLGVILFSCCFEAFLWAAFCLWAFCWKIILLSVLLLSVVSVKNFSSEFYSAYSHSTDWHSEVLFWLVWFCWVPFLLSVVLLIDFLLLFILNLYEWFCCSAYHYSVKVILSSVVLLSVILLNLVLHSVILLSVILWVSFDRMSWRTIFIFLSLSMESNIRKNIQLI